MAANALECDICVNVFSEDNCPRNLPCSHTFCAPCIDGIIMTQKKTCPTCRAKFTATSAEDLMINRSLLDVVKQLNTISVKPKILSKEPTGSFVEWKKFTKEILDEIKDVFTAIETLKKFKDGLLNTKKEIGRSKEMLGDIELSIESIISKITESGDQLESVIDLTLTECSHNSQVKVKKIKDLLQKNQRERDDIKKESLKIKERVEIIVQDIKKIDPAVDEPRFTEKIIGGKQMVAPARVKPRNQVRLGTFAEGNVPPKSLIIKHETLMNTSSRRAFLDLSIGETFLARIVIKVRDESNLALEFLRLCSGDIGLTYTNSHISNVIRRGKPGECIFVKSYHESVMDLFCINERERNIYAHVPYKAGEVRGFLLDGTALNCYIVTRDHCNGLGFGTGNQLGDDYTNFKIIQTNPFGFFNTVNFNFPYPNGGFIDDNCFGIVEEGLDALRNAILLYPNITDFHIVDCGLLLSE